MTNWTVQREAVEGGAVVQVGNHATPLRPLFHVTPHLIT